MHCQVDALFGKGTLDFGDKNAIAANLGQGDIGYMVTVSANLLN